MPWDMIQYRKGSDPTPSITFEPFPGAPLASNWIFVCGRQPRVRPQLTLGVRPVDVSLVDRDGEDGAEVRKERRRIFPRRAARRRAPIEGTVRGGIGARARAQGAEVDVAPIARDAADGSGRDQCREEPRRAGVAEGARARCRAREQLGGGLKVPLRRRHVDVHVVGRGLAEPPAAVRIHDHRVATTQRCALVLSVEDGFGGLVRSDDNEQRSSRRRERKGGVREPVPKIDGVRARNRR